MLKDKGCDVIKVGNAEGNEYSSTYIYDRKGNGEKAKRIAEILDVNEYKVELDDKTNADVTVILGKDKSNL
jgi:hypothetical protein